MNAPDLFPIRHDAEAGLTRREFARCLGLGAVALVGGTLWAQRDPDTAPAPAMAVGNVDDMPVGSVRQVRYPTEHDLCILVRLGEGQFVAYDQRCTHLGCPVHYRVESNQFVCPCHEGFFNATDGAVIAGPPQRPLRKLQVSVRNGKVWVQS
jgi:Rieske Fe-S protein